MLIKIRNRLRYELFIFTEKTSFTSHQTSLHVFFKKQPMNCFKRLRKTQKISTEVERLHLHLSTINNLTVNIHRGKSVKKVKFSMKVSGILM